MLQIFKDSPQQEIKEEIKVDSNTIKYDLIEVQPKQKVKIVKQPTKDEHEAFEYFQNLFNNHYKSHFGVVILKEDFEYD